jgi:putative heme transporter
LLKKALHWLLVALALGYIGYQAPQLVRSAEAAAGDFGHLHWEWAAAAAALGLVAVAVYAEIHRQLLTVGGVHVPARVVVSITFAQNAINGTIPVLGAPASIAYAISRLRRRGADSALAAWVVMLAGTLDTLCLIALAAVALAATGRLSVPTAAVGLAVLTAATAGIWALVTHPEVMRRALRPVLWLDRFIPTGCDDCRSRRAADLDGLTRRVATRVAMLRPSPGQWSGLIGITVLSWLVDFATLTASAAAAIQPVPWPALVLGFLVVQAAIALAILPAGAGLADLGLLGVLLGAGVAAGPAAATVLVYRTCSWLLPVAVGWINYGIQIHATQPRRHAHRFRPWSADLTSEPISESMVDGRRAPSHRPHNPPVGG